MVKMPIVLNVGRNGFEKRTLFLNPYYVAVLKISFDIDHRLYVPIQLLCRDD